MGLLPPAGFFFLLYPGYNEKERALQASCKLKDAFVMPALIFAYYFIVTDGSGPSSDAAAAPPPALLTQASAAVFALVSIFVLYQHVFVSVYPTEGNVEPFAVMQGLGRCGSPQLALTLALALVRENG